MNLIAPINIMSLEAIVVCILCPNNIILYTVLLPIFIMIYKLLPFLAVHIVSVTGAMMCKCTVHVHVYLLSVN